MCGRFVQVEKPEFYAEHFGAEFVRTETLKASYNIAPTSQVYGIADYEGSRVLSSFRWGLIPFWAKDRKIGARAINARSETLAEKPMFKPSFEQRRCLIPVDGFYEWERKTKGKLPHFIFGRAPGPLAVAGLWSPWRDPETNDRVVTCTIITGAPNALLENIHDRMPIVMPSDRWDAWLDPATDVDTLSSLMTVLPADLMDEYPVSTLVNKVANDTADLIQPLDTPAVHLD